jgi:hypothetical protein
MAGRSRLKNGVASLAYVPAIPLRRALCLPKRGHRDKPGDDEVHGADAYADRAAFACLRIAARREAVAASSIVSVASSMTTP